MAGGGSAVICIGGTTNSSSRSLSWMKLRGSRARDQRKHKIMVICCSSSLADSYKTLRIQPGASQSEVKKAFRHLALQYHPDVCRGSKCGVPFHQINQACEIVMSNLRGESNATEMYDDAEPMMGMNEEEPDWELWEGAGIRDYSSHINPYLISGFINFL